MPRTARAAASRMLPTTAVAELPEVSSVGALEDPLALTDEVLLALDAVAGALDEDDDDVADDVAVGPELEALSGLP